MNMEKPPHIMRVDSGLWNQNSEQDADSGWKSTQVTRLNFFSDYEVKVLEMQNSEYIPWFSIEYRFIISRLINHIVNSRLKLKVVDVKKLF